MRLFIAAICGFCSLVLGSSFAFAQTDWDRLAAQDLQLLRISERLMTANAPLCRHTMPAPGFLLHSRDQYTEEAVTGRFANGPIAIAAILPGGAAEQAGLRQDDALVSISGVATKDLGRPERGYLRESVFFELASRDPTGSIALGIRRGEDTVEVTLVAPVACLSLAEIVTGDGPRARSDGRVIQIRLDFAASLTDEQLAVVVAHELAHAVLEHRRRKVEAGIDNDLFAAIGRNQRANRQAEVEADRLSAHLLANAGFAPSTAASFWRSDIAASGAGNLLPSFVYPSSAARAELIEREIDQYLPTGRGPSWPGHLLALRDRAFTRD